MNHKILFVDDEPKVLSAMQRQLGDQFDITTAVGGAAGLAVIEASGQFAVVVSDMRMPAMDGIQFLSEVKKRMPDTARIMLTGCADFDTAVDAVNEGSIFRFLSKPCRPETLAKALNAGLVQYRLVTAERELLEKTLSGSVKVLVEVLSLVNPAAFGRASRVRRIVRELTDQLKPDNAWAIDLSAMLSQIGCVTLPPQIMDKFYADRPLSPEERRMLQSHPSVGSDLVTNIPRLEPVAEIIALQDCSLAGDGAGPDNRADAIPIGARILKVALDFDMMTSGGMSGLEAIVKMREHADVYDPDVLVCLERVHGVEDLYDTREIRIGHLVDRMILAQDVTTVTGVLLVCKGHEVTASLRKRLFNYAVQAKVREPLRVLVRRGGGEPMQGDSLEWSAASAGPPVQADMLTQGGLR